MIGAGVLLAVYLGTSAPVSTLRAGDVVSIVETQARERFVVRSADIAGGAVARAYLQCSLEEDRAGGCEWLSLVTVEDGPAGGAGEADGGLPAIVRKGGI